MNTSQTVKRFPVASYFIITFGISWLGAFLLIAPQFLHGKTIPRASGLLMFPIMLFGPVSAGIILTFVVGKKAGLRNLFSRMRKWKINIRWYLIALSVSPILILLTLLILKKMVSPSFAPNFFPIGFLFGIPAGFLEEIGWTGFATDKLSAKKNTLTTGLIVGLFWGLWHLPVIDFLGAASPHGIFLLPFFVSFILLLTAMRILMIGIYVQTKSIVIVQIMHIVSTGCLVMFGPSQISPSQEALWYFLYAVLLWIAVFVFYKNGFIINESSAKGLRNIPD